MVVKFRVVDKVLSSANFCNSTLALYFETHQFFWRHTDMTTTRDEDIDLDTREYMPVGHI